MNKFLPRVIVPTINVWQDGGNIRTLPEIFSQYDKDKIAQVYTKAGLPQTAVCDRFFRINENAVLKSVIKRSIKTSSVVENLTAPISAEEKEELLKQQKRYSEKLKKHGSLMMLCRELVWLLGKWKTKELDKFIEDFVPEALFVPVYPVVYMARIQLYIIKRTGVPVVSYISDDNYTYKVCGKNPFALLHRFWLRKGVKKIIKCSKEVFVISPKQKEEYDRIFGVNSRILTRAVDMVDVDNSFNPQLPLKMVYTGKLGIGRDKTLAEIAEAVGKINANNDCIRFSIYSGDVPSDKMMKSYSAKGVEFCGSVSSDEIIDIIKESHIAVFAESLEKRYKNTARLSFSTKLTDYLKSGRCIFAVGSRDIAPMDYLINEDAAVTVTSYEEMEAKLRLLCDNPMLVAEYGKKAYECGVKNHNPKKIMEEFKMVMNSLTEQ